jgi:hypothetical protein
MYYRAHFDGRGASVHADDVAAVRSIYPSADPIDPAAEDGDGDGISDAQDDCPTIPNPARRTRTVTASATSATRARSSRAATPRASRST